MGDASPIDFYFDFSSPYGYLAAQAIDAIAEKHGREVVWKPILLGILFKTTGQQPLAGIPLKGPYMIRDLDRSARRLGVPFVMPKAFPFMSVAAARACYYLGDKDSALAKRLAKLLYEKAFAEGRDISGAEAVVSTAVELGVDRQDLSRALQNQSVKDRLRREVEAAAGAGVFGSPFVVVDGEPFWGHDRLQEVDDWLASGGW